MVLGFRLSAFCTVQLDYLAWQRCTNDLTMQCSSGLGVHFNFHQGRWCVWLPPKTSVLCVSIYVDVCVCVHWHCVDTHVREFLTLIVCVCVYYDTACDLLWCVLCVWGVCATQIHIPTNIHILCACMCMWRVWVCGYLWLCVSVWLFKCLCMRL